MKVVTLKQLAELPKGTMFSQLAYTQNPSEDLPISVKDFHIVSHINEDNVLCCDGVTPVGQIQVRADDDRIINAAPVHRGFDLREGSGDHAIRYLVWSDNDVTKIIDRLAAIQAQAVLASLESAPSLVNTMHRLNSVRID